MPPVVFLIVGAIFSLIGRVLLLSAAFGVSVGWGIGVLLPFGPLFFRLNYPNLAPLSRVFRLAALPCLLAYVWVGQGSLPTWRRDSIFKSAEAPAAPANHYALEPKLKAPTPTLEERRAVNETELARLRERAEALILKKRDLLHSDTPGNLAYNAEVTEYNEAVKKAVAEKETLAKATR